MSRAQRSVIGALLSDYREYAGARLWTALAVMLLAAVAEGFGLLMIVPLTSIAIGRDEGALGHLGDLFGDLTPDQRFGAALAVFLAAMAARSLLLFARDVQTVELQTGYGASLRLRAAATLARRGWPFASRIGQAGMQSLLLNDVPRCSVAIGYVQQFLIAAAMLAVQLTLTAILSPALTALALLLLAAGGLVSLRVMRRGVVSGMAISATAEDSASSGFRLHAGLKAALAQATVGPFLDEYQASLARGKDQVVQFVRDASAAGQLAAFGAAVAAAVLLFAGVRILALPFPVLITSLILFARMSAPAQNLLRAGQEMSASAPSFAAIEQRLGKLEAPEPGATAVRPLEWNKLRLEAVRFEHQPGLGLRAASLILKRGEWLGVGGASGSGKTTLVDLVAGLLTPESGSLLVDGRALSAETLESWRAGLAYVGQEGTVFNDSVRGNLLAEGIAADHAALWEALELVGLGARIRAFPNGLGEQVGDRGSHLSGGERQRLVLARALLRKPRLLILDEATAALDVEGESTLLERLRSRDSCPAALIVAHRESTLAHCDSVASIRHGVLDKSGD